MYGLRLITQYHLVVVSVLLALVTFSTITACDIEPKRSDIRPSSARYQRLTDSGRDQYATWLDRDTIRFLRPAEKPLIGEVNLSEPAIKLRSTIVPTRSMHLQWSPSLSYAMFRRPVSDDFLQWTYWLHDRSSSTSTQLLTMDPDIVMVWDYQWVADESALIAIVTYEAEINGFPLGVLGPVFLSRIDARSGQAEKLAGLPRSSLFASLSPKGDEAIVSLSDPKAKRSLPMFKVNFGMAEVRQLPVTADGRVAWSPDGKRIAFLTREASNAGSNITIWVADSDGGNAKEVSDQAFFAWMPDSKRLLLNDYSLVNVSSGSTNQLEFSPDQEPPVYNNGFGPLAPDGKKILVYSDGGLGAIVWSE